jgi:hypothetical protein
MFTTAMNTRMLVALGGHAGSNLGLYVWNSPTFPTTPSSAEAIAYNDAPTFGPVAFGYQATTGAPVTTIAGLSTVNPPAKPASTTSVTPTASTVGAIPGAPATFVDGTPATPIVPIGTYPVPPAVTTPNPAIPATAGAPILGQVYVADLVAIDSNTPGKLLDLVVITEPVAGIAY